MEDLAELAIEKAMGAGAQFADLRIEESTSTSILIMDGKTKTMSSSSEEGIGIRAFFKGAWGFSSTNLLTKSSVRDAAVAAAKMAKSAQKRAKAEFELEDRAAVVANERYPCKESPIDVPSEEKLSLALLLDRTMREHHESISSTSVRYDDEVVDRLVANSFCTRVRTHEVWTLAACSAWASSEGVIQRGHSSIGSIGGYELMRTDAATGIAVESAAQAVRLLDSVPAPAGKFTVVLDNKMTGIMAHEAFGHACEADGVLAGASVLEGRLGAKVAHESVSLCDDPTIEKSFGYFGYDWEGTKARRRTLIEAGRLKGFLHNLETSSRMKAQPNGCARAQAYSSPPIIRMSNTFVAPGGMSKEELIEEVDHGILIMGSQYGYVEPAKGQFMFKGDEAYEIARGELGQRYRDVSISGVILEVLQNVIAVADDFILTDPGYCGKSGQEARVSDGGPHICISNMVVGGLV